MFRSLTFVLVSTVLLATGCAGESTTEPEAGSAMAGSSGGLAATRPASADCTTTFVPSDFTYPLLTIQIDGVCKLRHGGRATLRATQRIDVTNGSLTNLSTYVAANGDEIHTSFAGTSTSPPGSADVTFVGEETYIGGTGRFAGASGRASVTGSATLAPDQSGVGAYQVDGWITY